MLFISYSHRDKEMLDALKVHLKPLERNYKLNLWDDHKIKPGSNWQDEIEKALDSAKVALLLVSPHFLASDFIHNEELPPLLTAAEEEGTIIFPLIVGHCMFEETSIAKFQAFNSPSKPLSAMKEAERNKVFVEVARNIKNALMVDVDHAGNGKVDLPTLKQSFTNEKFDLSLARVVVNWVLYVHQDGLTISDVQKLSESKKRKNIVVVLDEMESSGLATKTKQEKGVCWTLTEKGIQQGKVIRKSILIS